MDNNREQMKQQLDSPFINSASPSCTQAEVEEQFEYIDLRDTRWRFLILFFVCFVKFAA